MPFISVKGQVLINTMKFYYSTCLRDPNTVTTPIKVMIAALAMATFLANLLASRKRAATFPAPTTVKPIAISAMANPKLNRRI